MKLLAKDNIFAVNVNFINLLWSNCKILKMTKEINVRILWTVFLTLQICFESKNAWSHPTVLSVWLFLNCEWPSFKSLTGQLISVRTSLWSWIVIFFLNWNHFKSQRFVPEDKYNTIYLFIFDLETKQYLSQDQIVYTWVWDHVCVRMCLFMHTFSVCEPLDPTHYIYG